MAYSVGVVKGVIERRILVNYRVQKDVLAAILPPPFAPKLVGDWGVAGICLIRLKQIAPQFLPGGFGLASENAAHRIAVTWPDGESFNEGVYVPRRDTSLWANVLAGGRIFPGHHHLARFDVLETDDQFSVAVTDRHGAILSVRAARAEALNPDSIFPDIEIASAFFEAGSMGYSATSHPGRFEGLELHSRAWKVSPLAVNHVSSSFFENEQLFPKGSVAFDCALLMENIPHQWRAHTPLCIDTLLPSEAA